MKAIKVILAMAIVALLPAIAWGAPGDGIKGTAHAFAIAGSKGSSTGLCARCHTPHQALATLLLWNRTLSTLNFKWDATATTAGTPYPQFKGDTYKGPTAKCLSCHDGSVTSKGFDAAKIVTGDLTGTHPVAMPYPYLQAKNTYNAKQTGSGAVLTEWESDPTSGTKIRLFNDDGSGNISAGVVATKTGLECSTCHDPHNKQAVDSLFLRGKRDGDTKISGYICLQCHIK